MYEQILIIANQRSAWGQRRVGRAMGLIEGGFCCRLCTYAYVVVVVLMALVGFYVVLSTIAQTILGVGMGLHVFHPRLTPIAPGAHNDSVIIISEGVHNNTVVIF